MFVDLLFQRYDERSFTFLSSFHFVYVSSTLHTIQFTRGRGWGGSCLLSPLSLDTEGGGCMPQLAGAPTPRKRGGIGKKSTHGETRKCIWNKPGVGATDGKFVNKRSLLWKRGPRENWIIPLLFQEDSVGEV
ncbi:hypothetical protein NPIL_218251 [Nephila pilipes]|uniref:Uncharacterized protein n=1 Tax=Nephila pilipes TaxID=299642 RepID=A0A8X6P2Z3_NEPPI|nr:hypothetical protein NPIL_218251 [Nephila pilipes]